MAPIGRIAEFAKAGGAGGEVGGEVGGDGTIGALEDPKVAGMAWGGGGDGYAGDVRVLRWSLLEVIGKRPQGSGRALDGNREAVCGVAHLATELELGGLGVNPWPKADALDHASDADIAALDFTHAWRSPRMGSCIFCDLRNDGLGGLENCWREVLTKVECLAFDAVEAQVGRELAEGA